MATELNFIVRSTKRKKGLLSKFIISAEIARIKFRRHQGETPGTFVDLQTHIMRHQNFGGYYRSKYIVLVFWKMDLDARVL